MGIGTRGPGETKLETDRRRIRDRISHWEKDIEDVARHQDQRRSRRLRQALPILSIVGYTNAGKSTLINTLTYDVAVSDFTSSGSDCQCMTFSGYRSVGCGDIYMTMRPKNGANAAWSEPKLILAQENVPFHNPPGSKNFEWGLEGAMIMQLDEDVFLLHGGLLS